MKSTSPTQRSLKLLRGRGLVCQVVEKWNAFAKVRQDLFGFIDIVCVSQKAGIVGVQTTTGSHISERAKKIKAEPRAEAWIRSGGRIIIHGWVKQGARGKVKTWGCIEREITIFDF